MPNNCIITINKFSATSLTIYAARSNSHNTIDPMKPGNVADAQAAIFCNKSAILFKIFIIIFLILSVDVSGSGLGSGFGFGCSFNSNCGCGCGNSCGGVGSGCGGVYLAAV